MEGSQDLTIQCKEANKLYRSFSSEVENRTADGPLQSDLSSAVVGEGAREDERQKELAE